MSDKTINSEYTVSMIVPLSKLSGALYKRLFKPILFRSSPDHVHGRLLRVSHVRQKFGWSNALLSSSWAWRDDKRLGQTIDGVYIANPVGLSAGFDKNVELAPTMKAIGFGFMTGGSVTLYPCEGNPRPWFYRLPKQKSLVVHVGLANEGAKQVRERLRRYEQALFVNFPLVVSIAKTNNKASCDDEAAVADYVGSLKLLQTEPSIRVLEINISCPNTYGGEPFTDPRRLDQLLGAIDELHVDKPIWIKMPINHPWEEFRALLEVIVRHNVQGVTIGNLNKQRSAIPSEDLPSQVKGNLSGLPTQKLSEALIGRTYVEYGDRLTIIGVGGVFSAEDAYRKIQLGASLVGLITGMIYEGPQLIGDINRQLGRLLAQDGFENITQARGSAHHKR